MTVQIPVHGYIVDDGDALILSWFGIPSCAPADVASALDRANGQPVTVHINSYGGSVFAGSQIYTDLKNYRGDVTVQIVGLAASAASVVAMAGTSEMSPTAQMMIHNASSDMSGNHRDMEKMAEQLRKADDAIANAYMAKCGDKDKKAILDMMEQETWMTAQEAKEFGLIDAVMFEDELGEDLKSPDFVNNSKAGVEGLVASLPMPDIAALRARYESEVGKTAKKPETEETEPDEARIIAEQKKAAMARFDYLKLMEV